MLKTAYRLLLCTVAACFLSVASRAQGCQCAFYNPNLLSNGDFENPNTVATPPNFIGFETGYSATAPIGTLGIFRRTTNANAILPNWCFTAGANNYLLFDGTTGSDAAAAPYDVLRYPNIAVTAGTKYFLTLDAMRLYNQGGEASITVTVNGTTIGTFDVDNMCTWKKHKFCWTANAATATIVLNAGTGDANGRDFALDNIFFGTCDKSQINHYGAVTDFDPCFNRITVDTSAGFAAGDTVLIIQMKGAVADTTNTAGFGDILALNSAGYYELNTISGKTGNIITLSYALQHPYDIPNGKVQIVSFPNFQDYTVSQPLSCKAWNGSKGGVLAMNVAGTLTLSYDIDVTGKGFRGGQINGGTTYLCDFTGYYYPASSNDGGLKGEGITEVSPSKMRGKGKLANGGGGGNNTNSGGGGGSNAGAGGDGGHQWESCNVNLNTAGVGGLNLNYSPAAKRLFLGGGGGTGQENNNDTDPGGNGGGIVFIRANTISGSGMIKANGSNCIDVNSLLPSAGDGQSGGGGGGAVLLDVAGFPAGAAIEAKGGDGGNIYATGLHGPGAGGGGGAVLFCNSTLPAGSLNLSGGISGVHINSGNPHYAQPGQTGSVSSNVPFTFPTIPFSGNQFNLDFTDSLVGCLTRQFINLTSPSGVGIASWLWDFGNGATSVVKDPIYTFPAAGTYIVKLIAVDSNGCQDSLLKPISLDTLSYSVTDTAIACMSVRLAAIYNSGPVANQFDWSFGDGATASGNPVTHTYGAAGSYQVTLIIKDSLGCQDTVYYGVPITGFDAGFSVNADTICQGGIVLFSNTSSSSANVFAWNFDDGGSEDSTIDAIHAFPLAGAYDVRLIVANAEQCVDTFYRTITADSAYNVEFYLNDSSLCEGRQVIFNAAFPDSTSRGIHWSFGDGFTADNEYMTVHSFDSAGSYTASVTVHFRQCPDATATHTIDIRPYPRLDLGPDTAMCPNGQAILLTDNINGGNPNARWLWNTGDSLSSIFVRHPGIYTARVDLNGCKTDDSVEVFKDCYIDLPNVFTPNGDGNNDYFFPRQLLSQGLTGFKMTVFNRWGQEVFKTIRPDGRGWDGKFNNVDQPQGVYVYLVEAVLKNNAVEKYQGNVTLLR